MAVNNTVFEIRPATGNALNGGGFNSTVTSPGTDWSQQTSPQVTFNGTTVTATTAGVGATITITGYTVLATDNGNVLKIASGTNFLPEFYVITSVSTGSNTWTLDRNCTSGAGAAMVGRMGGALDTLATLFTGIADAGATSAQFAGITAYMTGTYTATTSWTPTNSWPQPTAANPAFTLIGYSATRTDGVHATWTTATNTTPLMKLGNSNFYGLVCKHMKFSNTAGTSSTCVQNNGDTCRGWLFYDCELTGFTTAIDGSSSNGFDQLWLIKCEIHGNTTNGVLCKSGATILDSYIHDNTGDGFQLSGASYTGIVTVKNTVFYNNTGNGIYNKNTQDLTQTSHPQWTIMHCCFANNGVDGFKSDSAATIAIWMYNNIFYLNTNKDIEFVTNAPIAYYISLFNAFKGAATTTNWPPGADINITGDPWNGRTSADFSLNNTAGAGAALRAAGFPGISGLFGTGYVDVGALQHQDAGGGASGFFIQLNDNLNLSDSMILGYGLAIGDNQAPNWGDSVIVGFISQSESLSDTLSLSDSVSIQVIIGFNPTDQIVMTDSVLLNLGLQFHDSFTFSDAIATLVPLSLKITGDFLALSDRLALSQTMAFGFTDTLTLSDSLMTVTGNSFSDQFSFSDAVSVQVNVNLTESLSDTLVLTDSVTVLLSEPLNNYLRRYLNDVVM